MNLVRALACGHVQARSARWPWIWCGSSYKRGGGGDDFLSWEFASSVKSWDDVSAPAKVGKLMYEYFAKRELPPSAAALTTNVVHWAYGVHWGVLFAVMLGSSRFVRPWHAPMLGFLVWLASYVILPVAGFYKPIWQYDLKTLWQDLSAHLVYGSGVVLTFWRLCRS